MCMNNHFTRYRPGSQSHIMILDLVFTNDENMAASVHYHSGLGSSDHLCLNFSVRCVPVVNSLNTLDTTDVKLTRR